MLTPLAPRLWAATSSLYAPGGLYFSIRMVVVQLADGGLLLHSPVPIDDALAAALAELGPVRHLVAPNKLHHLHLAAAQARYPAATTWAAPGLADKIAGLQADHTLGEAAPPWADELQPHFVAGIPWMNETAFFHAATGTLVVTDLFFNFHAVPNAWNRFVFRMLGVLGKAKQSPLVRLQTRDKAAAAASAQALVALRPERVVPAHGDVVDDEAPARLEAILAGMIRRGGLQLATAA